MAAAPPPDPRFTDFFAEHHVLTLAVAKGNVPWCATCYYAWLDDRRRFVIASDPETRHMRDAFDVAHPQVAWAIALETKAVGLIRCVQSTGGLTEFPREIFDLADSLEVLNLSGNALSSLPDDLHRLTRLRVLFCSDNLFTELPDCLGQCAALTMVGFKGNRIERVPGAALPPLLRWLILTDN